MNPNNDYFIKLSFDIESTKKCIFYNEVELILSTDINDKRTHEIYEYKYFSATI